MPKIFTALPVLGLTSYVLKWLHRPEPFLKLGGRLISVALISCAVTACGGGGNSLTGGANGGLVGSGATVAATSPLLTGQFRDSPVEGLRFESTGLFGTTTGLTESGGQFKYRDGDQVAFFLGPYQVAKASGAPLITTFSATATDQEASNLARLLQSVDEDQNPNNGIRITTAASSNAVSLRALDLKNAISDVQLQQIVSTIYPSTTRAIVSKADADAHAALAERLSLLRGNEIYDVIVGGKSYPSTYNKTKLDESARSRLYLYLWSKWQRPMMQTILDSQASLINDIDAMKRRNDSYIDLADAVGDLALLSADVSKLRSALKAGDSGNEYVFKITGSVVAGIVSTIPAAQGVLSEPESAQNDNSSNYALAKAGAYAFGTLGGDKGSGINAAKEIIKASSDNPVVAASADLIGIGASVFVDNILDDIKSGRIILKGKKIAGGLPALTKDLTIAGARGVVSITAVPSLVNSIQMVNTYRVAQDVLSLWYESAGDLDDISRKLFGVSGKKFAISDMVDQVAKNYGHKENLIFASDWDRSLAQSLVAEQLGRTNALYRTYVARLGANSGDFISSISGLPTSGQQSVSYALSVNVSGNSALDQVSWSVNDGQATTQFSSKEINLVFDKTGTFTVQAITRLLSGSLSTSAAQISILSQPKATVQTVTPNFGFIGVTTTFTVSGSDLTAGMGFAVDDCTPSNNELRGGTANQRQFKCVFRGEPGNKAGVVKTIPGGTVLSTFSVFSSSTVAQLTTPSNTPTVFYSSLEFNGGPSLSAPCSVGGTVTYSSPVADIAVSSGVRQFNNSFLDDINAASRAFWIQNNGPSTACQISGTLTLRHPLNQTVLAIKTFSIPSLPAGTGLAIMYGLTTYGLTLYPLNSTYPLDISFTLTTPDSNPLNNSITTTYKVGYD